MFSFLGAFLSVFRKKQSVLPKVSPSTGVSKPITVGLATEKPKQGHKWVVQSEVEGRFIVREVFAHTKSEARALVKQEFGLSRLPVGTIILKKAA